MKKNLLILLVFIFSTSFLYSQSSVKAFDKGELLKFRISYGLLNAGIATLRLTDTVQNGVPVYHAKGIGYTTGVPKMFFKVYDNYESYFEKKEVIPHRFIRKIDEGGYTKDQEGWFNYKNMKVTVKDYEKKTEKQFTVTKNVQDIVSSFYYLRKYPGLNDLKVGESVEIDMFFDGEIFKFKLKYLGEEVLKTNFGKLKTLKFRPYVMAGRVFKEKESLTVWVSADANKVPVRIKASLAVGSLKADLEEYKNLVTKLEFVK
ncbi:DUF3108 domain-containing protein [Myroides profundi]|uniref:ATP-dependent exonuclease n=1 Tax=Myroides profundi TaxID=480520 RepID=A0AAJ4W0Y3_MYRPR|nr:DUF3108 domain-containing protein [Myroides profundi]AJH13392.1 hypothetical protein MPR_0175 [Myroides profundi]SEQ01329.1 Protein of unknown function [Myroides profundi]